MIPAFEADGTLPLGRHVATAVEVEQRFVQPFPQSVRRPALYADWRMRRTQIAALTAIEMEWLDGSFTTAKNDPGDIDLVTFVSLDAYNQLSIADRQKLFELAQARAKLLFGCDGYLVVVFPRNHPWEENYLRNRGYWDRQWSYTRPGSAGLEIEKGYVDVRGAP